MEEVKCNLCGYDDVDQLLIVSDRRYHLPGEFSIVRCRNCKLVYLSPRPSLSEISQFYPNNYGPHAFYAKDRKSDDGLRERIRARILHDEFGYPIQVTTDISLFERFLVKLAKSSLNNVPHYVPNGRILEVGGTVNFFV